MCTTYLGTLIVNYLLSIDHVFFLDYPLLVRLNPNIPFKTRGNGAVVIRFQCKKDKFSEIESHIKRLFDNYSYIDSNETNPGLVFWIGEIDSALQQFAHNALWRVLDFFEVNKFTTKENVICYGYNNKRGLIGAFAAIGMDLTTCDYTYELLIYRNINDTSKYRNQNLQQVWKVFKNGKEFLDTFSNVDFVNKVIKIFPHGPDPVFCGIRGNSVEGIISLWQKIQPQPKSAVFMIFRTNQGTDHHFQAVPLHNLLNVQIDLHPYQVIKIISKVVSPPKWEIGGHISFYIQNGQSQVPCYAYEPTKEFRFQIEKLIPGDNIEIGGAVRPADNNHPKCINIERIRIIKLAPKIIKLNPKCPMCNKRTKSMGKNQGYRCPKCRKKFTIPPLQYEETKEKRVLKEGSILLPAKNAHRHLTKPLERYGKENSSFLFNENYFREMLIRIKSIQPKISYIG